MTYVPAVPTGDVCALVRDPSLLAYDFGPYHPMSPVRLELTYLLAETAGVLDRPGLSMIGAPQASEEQLRLVHDADYIEAVRRASSSDEERRAPAAGAKDLREYGIGGDDVPGFLEMHEVSARIVGGSLAALDEILSGRARRAVNVAGGMHHARASQASGFCVYNDAAIAIRHAVEAGRERVLYVDLDVHHGDGVERALWDEPQAITLSVHETGESLFPGTGFVQDTGGPSAPGSAINVPLPPRTDADGWLRAIGAVVPALCRAVEPTLLVTQHGADTHRNDPLANQRVTLEGQRAAMLMLRDLADEVCGGRWLALGGGGYAVTDVVPRSWAHLIAIVSGDPLPETGPVPEAYVQRSHDVLARHGMYAEDLRELGYGDGIPPAVRDWAATGFDPDDDLDRTIQAARRVAFPEWGLDPFLD